MTAPIQDTGALLGARALASADPGREAAKLLEGSRPAAGKSEDPEQRAIAAKRLESLFATLLVKEMRATQSAGLFGSGTSADVYSGWFDQYMGEVLAKHGELHLADSITRSLETKGTPGS